MSKAFADLKDIASFRWCYVGSPHETQTGLLIEVEGKRVSIQLDRQIQQAVAERDRFRNVLELISRSDEFCGGTFVKELQRIAREALESQETVAPAPTP